MFFACVTNESTENKYVPKFTEKFLLHQIFVTIEFMYYQLEGD